MKQKEKLVSFNEWKKAIIVNEDVTIPAELSQQYLSIKKQIADKQAKKDQVAKAANQIDTEINRLTQNLIAIEAKAAQIQGSTKQSETGGEKEGGKPQSETKAASESLDQAWERYLKEGVISDLEKYPELDVFAVPEDPRKKKENEPYIDFDEDADFIKDYDDDYDMEDYEEDEEEPEISGDIEGEESLNGDFVFVVEVEEEGEENIIAKIYKDSEEENWKVRVVQGNEQPLEDMQIDSDMSKEDVIEKIKEIPGFINVDELDIEEYQDLLNDKDETDSTYYDDIIDVT